MVDLIVLGATFAAAGIAQHYKENCLVLEHGSQAGYEFFGALNFGRDTLKPATQKEAFDLQMNIANGGIYGGERHIYPCFQNANILFQTDVVSVEQTDGHFVCVSHGIDGFATYEARAVIDTRCRDAMCLSKTYNLLMESPETPVFSGATTKRAPGENRYILCCAVPKDCSYPEARDIARRIIQQFSGDQTLILSADVFDYSVKTDYPKTEKGIYYLPSKACENPALAFEAGLEVAV